MNKQDAIKLLNDIKRSQVLDAQYMDESTDYRDFITIYYKIGCIQNNLIWCNTVNDALEEINKLDKHKIAIEVNDDFIEQLEDIKNLD